MNGNGWKYALGVAFTVILAVVGALWATTNTRIDDKADRATVNVQIQTMDKRLERIENKVDQLLERR